MDLPLGTVKSRIFTARKQLKHKLARLHRAEHVTPNSEGLGLPAKPALVAAAFRRATP